MDSEFYQKYKSEIQFGIGTFLAIVAIFLTLIIAFISMSYTIYSYYNFKKKIDKINNDINKGCIQS
jgi:cell division protein FtsL